MKAGIHPDYAPAKITCACGRATETYSTVGEIHVEICSHCHPFFTGRQKLVDTAGRVERFKAKYGGGAGGAKKAAKGTSAPPEEVVAAAEPATESVKEAPAAEEALVDEPVTEAEALAADAAPAVEASQDDGSTDGVDEGEPETAAAES